MKVFAQEVEDLQVPADNKNPLTAVYRLATFLGLRNHHTAEEVAQEALAIAFGRYPDQQFSGLAKKLQKAIVLEAARNLRYLDKEVSIGSGPDKVSVIFLSADQIAEDTGWEASSEDATIGSLQGGSTIRPEERLAPVMNALPRGSLLKNICEDVLDGASMDCACRKYGIDARRAVDVLRKIGKTVTSSVDDYSSLPLPGVKQTIDSAVSRIAHTLVAKHKTTLVAPAWQQASFLA